MDCRRTLAWSDLASLAAQARTLCEETFFGHRDTDTRIDPDTGVIQKEGIFGWSDSEERIDPETGKHQVQGFFGWRDK